ncbi:AP2-like ethylene-responsive transcription factor ANT [Forsythia ovata]|uniref:AP2-like ethylene-responsive transcription factor ANT n=1 Tax=Forsythia ovata TaxID=205694 RepID=A0ABD1WVF6_9LAMI
MNNVLVKDQLKLYQNIKLNSLQENARQQQIHVQEYPHYSAFRGHDMYQQATQEEPKETCNLLLPTMADDEMKNWVSRNYPNGNAFEQKMGICMEDNGGESEPIGVMRYGDLHSLSLSISPGTQSSCITGSQHIAPSMGLENKKRDSEKVAQKQIELLHAQCKRACWQIVWFIHRVKSTLIFVFFLPSLRPSMSVLSASLQGSSS